MITDLEAADRPDAVQNPHERMMNFAGLRAAARRGRRFWLATAVLGLLVGLALPVISAHKYTASSNVYLVEPEGSNPADAMAVDVSLLQTTAVAARAAAAAHLNVSPAAFLASYKGTVRSNAIVSVTFTAKTPAAAVAGDAAVTTAFLEFRTEEYGKQAAQTVTALTAQSNSLESQINALTRTINSSSSADQITQLVNTRTSDQTELSQLQEQISQTQLNISTISTGSKVLGTPVTKTKSTKKTLIKDGLAGLIGGLALGLMIVLVGAATSERLYRREDIAATLAAPVKLSVGRYRRPRLLRQRRLARQVHRPNAALRQLAGRLRASLEAVPDSALATVSVAADEPAALAVAVVARSLESEGKRVAVIDLAKGHPLSFLFDSEQQDLPATKGGQQAPVPTKGARSYDDVDATLILATLDPSVGADEIAAWTSSAVVIVEAGKATIDELSAARQMLAEAHVGVLSAAVVGSDRHDASFGAAPAGVKSPLDSVASTWAPRW